MRYIRTFRIQAAHFNSQAAYDIVWGLLPKQGIVTVSEMLACARDVHGHNFKIVVHLGGPMPDTSWLQGGSTAAHHDWIVDDVRLAEIVMEWENTNLSMHQDFMVPCYRATTERMAHVLFRKLTHHIGSVVKRVDVYETDDIYATAEGNDG